MSNNINVLTLWPDLAKFRHLDKMRVYLVFDLIFFYFGKNVIFLLLNFHRWKWPKIMTTNLAIMSHLLFVRSYANEF